MADGADGRRCAHCIRRYHGRGWLAQGCVGAAPREQGQVLHVTPGPRLSFWSGLGQRRCRRGEEEDTVPGVADVWGPDGSGSWWGRRAHRRERMLGWLAGPVARSREFGRPRSGQACLRLRVGQRSRVSELGRLEEKGRLGRSVAWASSSLFSFFVFLFFSFV